jgi:hypothetical protein
MEVLERNLNIERCLCLRMKEEEEKFVVYAYLGSGTAVLAGGTDHAKILVFLDFGLTMSGTTVPV